MSTIVDLFWNRVDRSPERPALTALLALDTEAVRRWAGEQGGLADFEALLDDPSLHDAITFAVDRVNEERAPIEQIKAWRLIPCELTVTSGELTPTLKVRRDVVTARFGDLIEEMYSAAAA